MEFKSIAKQISQEANYGYFTMLGIKFTSTYQQIEKNYNTLLRYYQETEPSQQDLMAKIHEAYQIVKNENNRQEYLHNLMIRSYLSQPIEFNFSQGVKKEINKLFPFFIYEVFKEGASEVQINNQNQPSILQINFVNQTLIESVKEVKQRCFVFSGISSALLSKKEDEFIINFIDNGKILSQNYKARFLSQRDQIVKLTIYAKEIFEETKPTLEFHNPNTKQDMSLFKIQHFSIGENSKSLNSKMTNLFFEQQSTQNFFFWNDSTIPHASLFKGVAQKVGQKKFTFFTVGKTQMLVSRDENVNEIIQVVPLKKEYIAFLREENLVVIQVLNKTRKYKFSDKQGASTFIHSLMTVLNQKAQMPNIIINSPFTEIIQNSSKQKRIKLSQINKGIAKLESQLSELKLQKYPIRFYYLVVNSRRNVGG